MKILGLSAGTLNGANDSLCKEALMAARDAGAEIPHLKLLAWEPEGDFGRVDLLGTACGKEVGRRFSGPCTELAVILNASAVCPEKELEALLGAAVRAASERCRLELQIFREQCFGLGE